MVRAGREGQEEELAIDQNVALIGWSELGELNPGMSREDLKELIKTHTNEVRPQSLASQAGQLYRFIHDVAIGDLVVLPFRTKPNHVAIGRVLDSYQYRDDGPSPGPTVATRVTLSGSTERFPMSGLTLT